MDKIPSYVATCPTGTTLTSLTFVGKYDQLMLHIPKVVGFMGSSPVAVTLKGTPISGVTAQQMNYFDYVNKTPASCVITVSTGGIYEMPYPGAQHQIQVQFDVATTNVTNIYFVTPKTTF